MQASTSKRRHRAHGGRHRVALPAWSHRLVRALISHPKTVLVTWLIIVAVCIPFAIQLSSVLSKQGASKVVPGTDSAQADAHVDEQFPQHSERETVIVLSAADVQSAPMRQLQADIDNELAPQLADGSVLQTTSAFTAFRDTTAQFIQAQLTAAGATDPALSTAAATARVEESITTQGLPVELADLVRSSVGLNEAAIQALASDFAVKTDWHQFPLPVQSRDVISDNGHAAIVTVSYPPSGADPNIADLRSTIDSLVAKRSVQGATVNVTGEIPLLQDTYSIAEADNATMEYVAYIIILFVLLLFFRAVLPAIITVVIIALAMNVSQAGLFALGHSVHLTQFTVTIMTFVMLGAGIDYSMLLSSRYRQERLAGYSVQDATFRATVKAGESVVLAGTAVVLAFGATLFSPIDWIPPLGYGGLIGIPIILLAALTITPCALILLGDRFFLFGFAPLANMETSGVLSRVLRQVVRVSSWCPAAVVAVFVMITLPLAYFVGSHSLSADPVALSPDTDARRGAEAVSANWSESTLFPAVVIGTLGESSFSNGRLTTQGAAAVDALVAKIAAVPGVERVTAVTQSFGNDVAPTPVDQQPAQLRDSYLSESGSARIAVLLRGDPYGQPARDTVEAIQQVTHNDTTASWSVGGTTLVDLEYEAALQASFWKMIALVSVGIIILLTIALRSLVIPVRLVLTIMMSNVWALAITVAVFQVWLDQPVINDLPVFLVILMMGLGMDYEIFLITRVRELVRAGADDAEATATAVVDTGRVITAAGVVMAGSLGTMMLSSTLMLQQYGLGLGSAVLLDATVVRMFFVPASLLLFRQLNWWMPTLRIRRLAPA